MAVMPGQALETDPAGLQCAICIDLLCHPVSLSCSHTFCRKCLVDAFTDHTESFACPLCRHPVAAGFDPATAPICRPVLQVLERHCTVLYEQRLVELAAAAARTVHLRLGNRYETTGNWKCPHRWTVFVDLEELDEQPCPWRLPDIIDHVRFGLVPACKVAASSPCIRSEPDSCQWDAFDVPFEVTGESWGLFTVHVEIIWKEWLDMLPVQLEHFICNQSESRSWTYGVDLGSRAELCAEGLDKLRADVHGQVSTSLATEPIATVSAVIAEAVIARTPEVPQSQQKRSSRVSRFFEAAVPLDTVAGNGVTKPKSIAKRARNLLKSVSQHI